MYHDPSPVGSGRIKKYRGSSRVGSGDAQNLTDRAWWVKDDLFRTRVTIEVPHCFLWGLPNFGSLPPLSKKLLWQKKSKTAAARMKPLLIDL